MYHGELWLVCHLITKRENYATAPPIMTLVGLGHQHSTSCTVVHLNELQFFFFSRTPKPLRMDSDRIRMKSDPNVTFYHILIRIRMRMRISSDMNTKRIVRIRIRIRIPSRFETQSYHEYQFILSTILQQIKIIIQVENKGLEDS